VLTATLTVDSSDAKSVIEGSLDKLTQQLHKADVKVDRIEVNLAGEEPQQQSWFDRRPDWTRRPRHWSQSNENETSDIAAIWTPSLTSANAAISMGTLNILA
jgi:flagellar hook-length control protein FliK